jgi:hypothetical protein
MAVTTRVAVARDIAYAIVIGNNAPPVGGVESLRPLRYSDDDAVRYHQLFSRFADSHLLVVLDTLTQRRYPGLASKTQPPTRTNLDHLASELSAKMQSDRARGDRPILYFAFSGHGTFDDQGEPFLSLLDAKLTQKALFDDVLARLPATLIHVIVDACHAGGVVGVRGGGFFDKETSARAVETRPADIAPLFQSTPLMRHPNIGVILAATVDQETHEWSVTESGVFSHEVISGLLGAADVNSDGRIEYTEIAAFVAAANRDIRDPRATPRVIARPPALDQNARLVALPAIAGVRTLSGNLGRLGHFYVELANGQRYLDAHLDGDRVAFVAPTGAVAYLRTNTREAKLPPTGDVAIGKLVFADRDLASRGSIEATYQNALFASSYGPEYYRGYVDSVGAIGVAFAEDPSAKATTAQRATGNRRIAYSATAIAAVGAVTGATFGALAIRARSDFNNTDLQRAAHDAQVRYDRDRALAIGGFAVTALATAVAWWLWPRSSVSASLTPSGGDGSYRLWLNAHW